VSLIRLAWILLIGLGVLVAQPDPAAAQTQAWPRAMELMTAGEPEAALPLLESLVSQDPNNKRYRFELALALFHLDKFMRSKWHLEQVRGADLTPPEAKLVERLLAEIGARSVWSGSMTIALRPETNASRKTAIDTINIGGLNFQLTPDSKAKPGVSLVTTTGLTYSPKITQRLKASFGMFTNLRFNEDKDLRDYQIFLRQGLSYFPDTRSRFAGGLQQGYRWVGDRGYSSSLGVWAEHSKLIGPRGRLDFGLDLSETQYRVGLPDSQRGLITAGYSHAVTGNATIGITGFIEKTQGSRPDLVGNRAGISITGLYGWEGGLMTSLRFSHRTDKRDGPETLFGITRNDQNTAIEANIYHRDFRIMSFAPTLALGFERNQSNVSLARYDNSYVSIGLTHDF